MAKFCNQFDRICAELGCAAIYCHHHSKGAQGGKKSMDRASGSGVFARDPDAQLDLIELPVSEDLRKQQMNRAICNEIIEDGWAERACESYRDEWGQDDLIVADRLIALVENNLKDECVLDGFRAAVQKVRDREAHKTAWQVNATLREFQSFDPINLWFEYPIHRIDDTDVLKDVKPEAEKPFWEKAKESRRKNAEAEKVKKHDEFVIAYNNLALNGEAVKMRDLADSLGIQSKTIGEWFRKNRYKIADDFERYCPEEGGDWYVRPRAVDVVDHG
jgi:RecA-family ATPase